MRSVVIALLLLSVLPAFAGKPKPRPTLVKLEPSTEQIKDLIVPVPKQHCPNWAWAAEVEATLLRQHVVLDQTSIILKANGGELCIEKPVDLGEIKKAVEQVFVQPDGSKVQITAVITPGVPNDIGYVIRSVREGQLLLTIWQGRPVVLQAVEYDEYVYPNNQRMFQARKLTFLDPTQEKFIVFDKATDDLRDFGGMIDIRVGPVEHFR
jgi:hypothetical protein